MTPESDYKGKRLCVTGKITKYRNEPEIVGDSPELFRTEATVANGNVAPG
jgi:hypothetical protein